MNNPKISVLMPIYNTDKLYLKEAIESILNQTFVDFEFIILNDSPDNTELDDIVKSYKDKRIKYLKNEKNMGITLSRNKLIDLAKGEYLAVMDHDDISLPSRFEEEVKYLDENKDVGVVSCLLKRYKNTDKAQFKISDNHEIKLHLLEKCVILHPASMIRKSVLTDNNIRYEKNFSPAEDYALWCRLIPFTEFHIIQDVLFLYRDHTENTSHKQSDKMAKATYVIRSLVKINNPALYDEFLRRKITKTRIKLFGFFPLITSIKKGNKVKVYLFEKLLILSIRLSTKIK